MSSDWQLLSSCIVPNPILSATIPSSENFYQMKQKSTKVTSLIPAKNRRKRTKWSSIEIEVLRKGMEFYGTNWAGILGDERFKQVLKDKTQMQCKDKAAVEKERRVKEALKDGRVATFEELGVWRYACDRKRVFS